MNPHNGFPHGGNQQPPMHHAPMQFPPMQFPPADDSPAALAHQAHMPWQQLDKRMIWLNVLQSGIRTIGAVALTVGLAIATGGTTGALFLLAGVAAVVLVVVGAAVEWATTKYRIGPVHVELRRGVVLKKLVSIPRSRIRSVDVKAGVLQRILGISTVTVGTGTQTLLAGDANNFVLNGLSSDIVPMMRAALLSHTAAAPMPQPAGAPGFAASVPGGAAVTWPPPGQPHLPAGAPASGPASPIHAQPQTGEEIGHWKTSWVRFAPFSLAGVVTVGAALGLAFQFGVTESFIDLDRAQSTAESAARLGAVTVAIVGLLVLLVVSSITSCVRYLLANANLKVIDSGGSLDISRGLLSTQQSTLDLARMRGASLVEPLLLRMVRAAKLNAIMTGVGGIGSSATMVLPQSPVGEAKRVMGRVLRDPRLTQWPLLEHGPVARRRCYIRALIPAALFLGVGVIVQFGVGSVPIIAWVGIAVFTLVSLGLAHDRYRGLGHAVVPGWLITRSGSLYRTRSVLEPRGIIGWTVHQSFFQRRSGLATVTAATPAGIGAYSVVDIPVDQAWELVEAVTPGAGDVWVRRDRAM